MTYVRAFSPCGPCLKLGRLTSTTEHFYCYEQWKGGDQFEGAKKIRINKPGTYSRAHIKPCPSCPDHQTTSYPLGYMD